MHMQQLIKKEAVNLKENEVGYMGAWWVSVSVVICCREEREGEIGLSYHYLKNYNVHVYRVPYHVS